ncbi:MAG: hypothetical protein AAF664_21460 [Planctomycetota bacterium]
MSYSTSSSCRFALTLVELVVVLVILAALTGIAVQSLEPLADQSRLEATQTTLQNVDDAILQQTRSADGTLGYLGFVADMGRLPLLFDVDPSASVVNLQPVELWTNDIDFDGTADLTPYALRNYVDPFTGDQLGSVIGSGWRGPYIQAPTSEPEVRDGYGRPLTFEVNAANKQLLNFESFGADGQSGSRGGTYDPDSFAPSGGYGSPARFKGSLDIMVTQGGTEPEVLDSNGQPITITRSGTQRLFVRVFGPSPGQSMVSNVATEPAGDATILVNELLPEVADDSFDAVVPTSLSGLTFGTYLVQALVTERSTGSFSSPPAADGDEDVVINSAGTERRSRLHRVVIQPGITSLVLEIPPP